MKNLVDLQIINAKVLNVFNQKFEATDLWINDGKIISNVKNDENLMAKSTIDLTGKWIVPGMIDAHVHMESSMVTPSELGKILLKHGVTTIVTDPHELANVIGVAGIQYLMEDAKQTALDVKFMLPSSVPCIAFDHNGAILTAKDLNGLYKNPEVVGLAEVMDYPAIVNHDFDLFQKINDAKRHGKHVDGHAAGYSVSQLNQLRQAGADTDHEATTVSEALDRVNSGFYVFLRQGTVENDLLNTMDAVNDYNFSRFAFCTDDKTITDIIAEGSIDHNVRLAIAHGMQPELAYIIASYNGAQAHRLYDQGALSTGFLADLIVLDDLNSVKIDRVMKRGNWIADSAQLESTPVKLDRQTVKHHLQKSDLKMPLNGHSVNVIEIEPNHITTHHLIEKLSATDNFESDVDNDLLKMVVIERHHNLGTVGLGIVKGFKLNSGAIASSIAHDAHNIVAFGTNDEDIFQAIEQLTSTNGGLVIVNKGELVANMPLPIGGLLSDQSYEVASQQLQNLLNKYQQISHEVNFDPFITLSFLTLPVIPELKLTDQGLYDVTLGKFIPLEN